jgi:hypothetical protein
VSADEDDGPVRLLDSERMQRALVDAFGEDED